MKKQKLELEMEFDEYQEMSRTILKSLKSQMLSLTEKIDGLAK